MAVVTEITVIAATPSPASPGQTVNAKVGVKNLGLAPAGYNYIALTGTFDSTGLSFTPDYQYADAQATVEFNASFTMPSMKTRVTVYSWYWDFSTNTWIADDAKYIDIETSEIAVGWVLVDKVRAQLSHIAGEVVVGWVLVDKVSISLKHSGVPLPPTPEEGKVNWGLVAGIGAGVVGVIAIGAALSKKEGAKKP